MDAGGRATQEQLPRTQMAQMIMMNTDNLKAAISLSPPPEAGAPNRQF